MTPLAEEDRGASGLGFSFFMGCELAGSWLEQLHTGPFPFSQHTSQ